ncbi:MAG: cytochrome c biogenesis protein CcdA [Kiritimatiellia bacterium]|nr:cytochrome c biogenesis protein CcdA [Kiritimatiellia bacterium]
MTTARYIIIYFLMSFSLTAGAEAPFAVSAALDKSNEGEALLSVSFSIRNHCYLYGDRIKVEAPREVRLSPVKLPPPMAKKYDESAGSTVGVYTQDVTFIYAVKGNGDNPLTIKIMYQGCSETMCFLPMTETFSLALGAGSGAIPKDAKRDTAPIPQLSDNGRDWNRHFNLAGRTAGYLNAESFMEFLNGARSGKNIARDKLHGLFEERSVWVFLALILLGGFALNLTPCVLPLIPINIAIIGAGAKAESRARGFALGGVYGMGMALVYGALGLFAVLTGSKFGALNLSPVFNAITACVFVLLALAMFDVFSIDFSRFQWGAGGVGSGRGKYPAAFLMGAFTALLAGACIAPVLISVLLLSADLYARHNPLGLILPFVLGAGMALPWPFVGAGLSFLPKPGRWMTYVKYAFGLVIIGAACYYAHLAYELFTERNLRDMPIAETTGDENGWHTSLILALDRARQKKKPVFIDFQAPGCKSCVVMEKTTFEDPRVTKPLEEYIKVKFDAGNLKDPAVQVALDDFGVKGFPTYVVLIPKRSSQN